MTDVLISVGEFFQWTAEAVITPIGYWFNWILVFTGGALLFWWCMKLFSFGGKDKSFHSKFSS